MHQDKSPSVGQGQVVSMEWAAISGSATNDLGTAGVPADFSGEYRTRTDEELLQLWVERSDLLPEAERALQSEIDRRGLTEQAVNAKDIRCEDEDDYDNPKVREDSDQQLAPPVAAWGPSITWYWLREMWLRQRTKDGLDIQAKVESALLTRANQGRGGGGRRAELCYSYDCQGPQIGRTVRDFMIGDRVGRALAFAHKPGDTITIRVDSNVPYRSYFPSGFGWIEPLFWGVFFSILALFLLTGAVVGVFDLINR